jgi:diadenosine tetraphosphate (Ap4A) HIT family hydrolase
MNCIFCRIAKGEIGELLAETRRHVVVMDTSPLSKGHVLVIPKHHSAYLHEMPDDYLRESLVLLKGIKNRIGSIDKYNVLQNNGHHQSVAHVHFHLIPFDEESGEGLSINWNCVEVSESEFNILKQSYKHLLKGLGEEGGNQ